MANILVDISGNGNNGVASNVINTKDGLALYGVNSKISYGNIGNVKSVSFRIKPASTTCKILEGRANAALVHINSGTLTASDFANIYIDGIAGATMAANKWQTVTLTSASDVAFSAFTLGLNNTTYGAFEVADLRIWNRQISLIEAKQYHNSFASNYFTEDFSDLDCSGNNVIPKGMIQGTGLFKGIQLANDVVSGGLRLKKYQKGIECTQAGTVSFPSSWNSGRVEIDWYKGADASLITFKFIGKTRLHSDVGGYSITAYSDEALYLDRTAQVGLCNTPTSYIQNNTYYTIAIERTNSGQFTLLIKGGSFIPTAGRQEGFTLVSVVGGSGSNPVTDTTYNSSSYGVISAAVGDRIMGIRYIDGIKQL